MYHVNQVQIPNVNNQEERNKVLGDQYPNNPNIILVPINSNQNFPQALQIQEPLWQETFPQNSIYHAEIGLTKYEEQTTLLKEQNFNHIRGIFSKILEVFVMWHILTFVIQILYNQSIEGCYYKTKLIVELLLIIIWLVLMPLGTYKKFRQVRINLNKNNKQIIIFVFLIVVQAIITWLLQFHMIFDTYFFYNQYRIDLMDIVLVVTYTQLTYTLVTVILIIYLQFISKEIKQLYFTLLIFIVFLPAIYLGQYFYIIPFLAVFYAFLLISVLRQISIGRFKIKINQLFTTILATNYGIFVPFWVED